MNRLSRETQVTVGEAYPRMPTPLRIYRTASPHGSESPVRTQTRRIGGCLAPIFSHLALCKGFLVRPVIAIALGGLILLFWLTGGTPDAAAAL